MMSCIKKYLNNNVVTGVFYGLLIAGDDLGSARRLCRPSVLLRHIKGIQGVGRISVACAVL